MQNISYTISPFIIHTLEKIELLRREILLSPLSPKKEQVFRFQAMTSRIESALQSIDTKITKEEILSVLTNQSLLAGKEKNKQRHQHIMGYKKAFDYLMQEWLVVSKTVTSNDLIKLHRNISKPHLVIQEKQLQEILDYLQTSSDSPLVQAAIVNLKIQSLHAFPDKNDLFAILCSYLFLYKAGLDFRGLLVLEKMQAKNPEDFSKQYQKALGSSHITGWIEYFVQAVLDQLLETWQRITEPMASASDKIFELNERQKRIVQLLDAPFSVITNRDVQMMFAISQITASRDLAKLAGLGLLFVHGKGRSVRYTKA
jgi:hypothetical protein